MKQLSTLLILICVVQSVFGQFQTNNNATALGGDIYRLTPNTLNQAGSVWYKLQHDLDEMLVVSGQLYFGTDPAGADGICFVLQDNCLAAGTIGGGVGYRNMPGRSIGIEFDTYENIAGSGDQNNSDPPYDHLAVEIMGNVDHANAAQTIVAPLQIDAVNPNVEDGAWHNFTISYDPVTTNLRVYFNGNLRINLTYDIKNNIFAGNPFVYWGFTASTGGFANEQSVYINGATTTFTLSNALTCTDPVNVTLPPLTKFNGSNLALNKTAVGSSDEWGGNSAPQVADGNLGTRWSSLATDNQWIYVDLGSACDLDSVILRWEGAYGRQYKIQTSTDASSWTDRYTETNGDGGKDKIVFSASNVRYVRMLGIQRGTGYGYSLWELQAFGRPKYVWSPDNGTISDIYSASPVFTPTVTTTYTVIIPDPCSAAVPYNFTVTVDCSLPATLVSFEADACGTDNCLKWITSSEYNTDYFEVLRSEDGIHFYSIGKVNAAANSNTSNQYYFTDKNVSAGTLYYQLVTVDQDGSSEKSKIVSLDRNTTVPFVPLPVFENETSLILPSQVEWLEVTVTNILGQNLGIIHYDSPASSLVVGTGWSAGTYWLNVRTDAGQNVIRVQKVE